MKTKMLSHGERGKLKGRFKRIIRELSQFSNKEPEEIESESDYFDVDNSYPTLPFKGVTLWI